MSPQILRGIESVFDRADRWPVHQLRRITLNVENLCPVHRSFIAMNGPQLLIAHRAFSVLMVGPPAEIVNEQLLAHLLSLIKQEAKNMAKVWLITGSGNGLGRDIAEAALAAGDTVVAGARRLEELNALVEQYGERVTPVKLDVREEAAAKAAVQTALDKYGRLDVLVNNAGYGYIAPFEQMTSEQFRDVIETCLFGVVYTTRAAVPVMRKQKSGHIFQVSSIGGRITMPGNSPYHAAKWAVGGFSDSLAAELAPLGVKVCSLEPGGIRTNWAQRASEDSPEVMPEYEESVGSIYKLLAAIRGKAESDPKRIAAVVVKLANAEDVPKRLILGKDAEILVKNVESARAEEATKYRDLTLSTVFPDAPVIPGLPNN
jgi:NAD(P)-dependent dehydrogenase (short-subunit alcohol dehydrogenase family)